MCKILDFEVGSNKIKLSNQNGDLHFREMVWVWIPPIWRPVLSLFYPPVIIRGKNGKNSESPVGSNKNEKRKPKSAVYRSFWASVVYFHLRLISTKNHKGEMTRNAVVRKGTWVRIPPLPPSKPWELYVFKAFSFVRAASILGKPIQMVPLVPRFVVPGSFHIIHTIQERCILWCPNGARNC